MLPGKDFEYRSSYFGSRSLFRTKILNYINIFSRVAGGALFRYKRSRHKKWQKNWGDVPLGPPAPAPLYDYGNMRMMEK